MKADGELFYPQPALHAVGHRLVEELQRDPQLGFTRRAQFLDYVKDPENAERIANNIMFDNSQTLQDRPNLVPDVLVAPEVQFYAAPGSAPGKVTSVSIMYAKVSEVFIYNEERYVRTQSGWIFNATKAVQQIQRDLPWGVETVLEELNIN